MVRKRNWRWRPESGVRYNVIEVKGMAVAREYVKALIDRLTDDQVEALKIILEAMALPAESLEPGEAEEIDRGFAEIDAGKGVRAEDAWKELGI
ncbi:MAG: hypothetical protein QHH27_10485 [Clostridia bacterium]|nr:hypothetical protein [Clostridia bacterium]MDH7573949.1 hypothetical protein [Clostridia bacterium]